MTKDENMLKNLIKLANHLDSNGLSKEADHVDWIIFKFSNEQNSEYKLEQDALATLSVILKKMTEADIYLTSKNESIKLEAKEARNLYDHFMANDIAYLKRLDPSIMSIEFKQHKHEMTVQIATGDDVETFIQYNATVTPNFVMSEDKSKFVDSANVTIVMEKN